MMLKKATALLLSYALFWGANPTSARGEARPRVIVADCFSSQESFVVPDVIIRDFHQAFANRSGLALVDPSTVENLSLEYGFGKKQVSRRDSLKEARRKFQNAKKAYQNLHFEESIQILLEVRDEFIRNLPELRTNREFIEVYMLLGSSYIGLDHLESAKLEFSKLVRLDPTYRPETKDYPPATIQAFSEARQTLNESLQSRFQIDTEPPGAKVFLNGKNLGVTPLEVKLPSSNSYFLLFEKDGFEDWFDTVQIQRPLETFSQILNPSRRQVAWSKLFRTREGDDQQTNEVRILQKMTDDLSATFVFLCTIEKTENPRLMGQLFDARTKEFSMVAVDRNSKDMESLRATIPEIVDALLGFIQPNGYLVTTTKPDLNLPSDGLTVGGMDRPTPSILETPKPKKEWYEHWWVWGLAGVFVAGAVIGGLTLGGSSGSKVVLDNRGNL